MTIDMHIHSLHSDGTYSPTDLVQLAHKRGLSAISLTDHDTISGIPECISAGLVVGIEVVSGIELSVVHRDENLHLLGYFFNHEDKHFNKKINVLQNGRKRRNHKIIARLNEMAIDITMDEVLAISQIGQTGRPHIAKVLVNKGAAKNLNEAFNNYLGNGAAAYISRFVYSAAEAIEIIKKGGGLAVLAHPVQLYSSYEQIAKTVDELVEFGLDGLEVYYPKYSGAVRRKLKAIVKRHNMVMSGGSDYHGQIRPGTDLAGGQNICVPPEILEEMRERLNGSH